MDFNKLFNYKTGEYLVPESGTIYIETMHGKVRRLVRKERDYESYTNEDDQYIKLPSSRKYSKVFHLYPVKFSNPAFKGYWYDLVLHLEKDTNAIYYKERDKVRPRWANSYSELAEICETSVRTIERFVPEMKKRNYLGIWEAANGKAYVINPKYAVNGYRIDIGVWKLFNPKEQCPTRADILSINTARG